MPLNSKSDKSSFPPISNRPKLSTSSNEQEQSTDSYREQVTDNVNDTKCESPVFKLPTIERTKSRSISNLGSPGSVLGSRQFSRDKPSRRSICRSPSCPSNLGLARSDSVDERAETALEQTIYDHFPPRDDNDETNIKLPCIFRNASSLPMSPRHSTLSNKWKADRENGYVYSLRRTESFADNTKQNQSHEPQQTHALLLPLRNVDNVKGKKKKKKHSKAHSTGDDDFENAVTERESELGRWSGFENDQNQINGSKERLIEGPITDRSVEIVSARKMKKWMKQHPQKEGQVKA